MGEEKPYFLLLKSVKGKKAKFWAKWLNSFCRWLQFLDTASELTDKVLTTVPGHKVSTLYLDTGTVLKFGCGYSKESLYTLVPSSSHTRMQCPSTKCGYGLGQHSHLVPWIGLWIWYSLGTNVGLTYCFFKYSCQNYGTVLSAQNSDTKLDTWYLWADTFC